MFSVGGWITCTKQYVGQLPIRRIKFTDPAEKSAHDEIVKLVEQMLELQKQHQQAEIAKEDARFQPCRSVSRNWIKRLMHTCTSCMG